MIYQSFQTFSLLNRFESFIYLVIIELKDKSLLLGQLNQTQLKNILKYRQFEAIL